MTETSSKPQIPPHLIGASIRELQKLQGQWADYQPWDRGDGTLAFIGMIEELGEMAEAIGWTAGSDPEVVRTILLMSHLGRFAHATLKRLQGIRANEDHEGRARLSLLFIKELATPSQSEDCGLAVLASEGDDTDLDSLTDGFGDIVIYGFDVANRKEFDAQRVIEQTCEQVFARDWRAFPSTGRPDVASEEVA